MKIKEVILFTNNIQNQKQFYKDTLCFELLCDSKEKVSFKTGTSILSFVSVETPVNPSHFAFNIPSNQAEDALKWLQERVEVLPSGDDLISDFVDWNAKAIYFYDNDRNIVEFIARKNLEINSNVAFSSKSVVSISEMAIAVNTIKTIYRSINHIKHISIYSGDLNRFCALGNDEGLFILVNKAIKGWHPTKEEAFTSNFIIKGDYNFSFENGEVKELL